MPGPLGTFDCSHISQVLAIASTAPATMAPSLLFAAFAADGCSDSDELTPRGEPTVCGLESPVIAVQQELAEQTMSQLPIACGEVEGKNRNAVAPALEATPTKKGEREFFKNVKR